MESNPNIFYFQPYALDFCYGRELNKHINPLPDNAWIVITDQDTLFLTPNAGRIINNAIITYPETELFTCQTNRLGNPVRCYGNTISIDSDIRNHIRIAEMLERKHGHKSYELKDRIVAGMFMCFPKNVWEQNKFDDKPIIHKSNNHLTSFDVRFTQGIKGSIKRIEGLYIFHTYRLNKQLFDTSHLEIN